MPSGWKCDLVFRKKIEEIIAKYKPEQHAKMVKEVMALCGTNEVQARANIQSMEEIRRLNVVLSKNTMLKITPTMALVISRIPEEIKLNILKRIDNGELETIQQVNQAVEETLHDNELANGGDCKAYLKDYYISIDRFKTMEEAEEFAKSLGGYCEGKETVEQWHFKLDKVKVRRTKMEK